MVGIPQLREARSTLNLEIQSLSVKSNPISEALNPKPCYLKTKACALNRTWRFTGLRNELYQLALSLLPGPLYAAASISVLQFIIQSYRQYRRQTTRKMAATTTRATTQRLVGKRKGSKAQARSTTPRKKSQGCPFLTSDTRAGPIPLPYLPS